MIIINCYNYNNGLHLQNLTSELTSQLHFNMLLSNLCMRHRDKAWIGIETAQISLLAWTKWLFILSFFFFFLMGQNAHFRLCFAIYLDTFVFLSILHPEIHLIFHSKVMLWVVIIFSLCFMWQEPRRERKWGGKGGRWIG